jgi:hypothetical protein
VSVPPIINPLLPKRLLNVDGSYLPDLKIKIIVD